MNLFKMAGVSAVLAGVLVATDRPTAGATIGTAGAARSAAELRCDGAWPAVDSRCAGAEARAVPVIGLDRAADAASPYRVTEVAGPILR